MKKLVLPGALLLLAGVYLLLSRLPGIDLPMGSFLALMGAGFLVVRAVTRKYGWSFAAFPLLGLGLSWVVVWLLHLGSAYIAAATLLGLALAFFLIQICEFRKVGNWPVIPACILLIGGLAALTFVMPNLRSMLRGVKDYILPTSLILLGFVLLIVGIVAYGKANRKQKPQNPPYTPPYTPPQPDNVAQEPKKPQDAVQEEASSEPIILGATTESSEKAE